MPHWVILLLVVTETATRFFYPFHLNEQKLFFCICKASCLFFISYSVRFRYWVSGWHTDTETKRTRGRTPAPSCNPSRFKSDSQFSWSVPSTRLNTGILFEGSVHLFSLKKIPACVFCCYIYYVLDFSRIQCADDTVLCETVLCVCRILPKERNIHQIPIRSKRMKH